MNLYQKILGTPFVYNHVRPLAVGGIDMSEVYARVESDENSVVLDIGCGTGDALRYLKSFASYSGIDTDDIAISHAKKRHENVANAEFRTGLCTREDMERIRPTHIVMAGLLHHLTDEQAADLLRLAAASPSMTRIVTQDIVYIPGRPVNNLLASMDRGKFCRNAAGYEALVERAGLTLRDARLIRCHPGTGLAWYQVMVIEPAKR